ncbi:hypothetical protein ScPMuIL_012068, partial [Solemya velum]
KMPGLGGKLSPWILLMCCIGGFLSQDCDQNFSSNHQSRRGTFHSPNWPGNYPTGKRCEYKFIAKLNQRVRLQFTSFNIQGLMPSCQFDYLDIYVQLRGINDNLLDAPLLGRFCGEGLEYFPKLIISTNNIIILVFYSDSNRPDKGFEGRFEFVDASIYDIGIPVDSNSCGYQINSNNRDQMGYIVSPTYPGVYPDNLSCFYRLNGRIGERIKLNFRDFSLFHGGEYCPFDFVAVYDGKNNKAPVIGVFCGRYENVTLYSTSEDLYVEFITRSGRVDFDRTSLYESADFSFDRRGFNITYEFNNDFVKLDFLADPGTQHVRGTECDVRIKSLQNSNGTLTSPGYFRRHVYPLNVICTYYLDGIMNKQTVEKVIVRFMNFNITESQNCNLGALTVNYQGYRHVGIVDERYCGSLLPPKLISKEPRMVLTLNTLGAAPGRGFNATYHFLRDFGIPGRHVGPEDKCTYLCVNTDYVEILEKNNRGNYTFIRRYCGKWYPGPFLGDRETKVIFYSGFNQIVGSTGFRLRYEFVPQRKLKTDCGQLINSATGENGGIIKSPNFPEKYGSYTFCEWTIKASKSQNRILLQFDTFVTEGMRGPFVLTSDDTVKGCAQSVVRIYFNNNSPPMEVCGPLEGEVINSTQDRLKISFLTASQALSMKGFNIAWTERHEGANCYGFKCKKSGFCISSELKCNGLPNCGKGDTSDEVEACPKSSSIQILHIAIGTSISSFFCIILLVCGVYHRRKFRTDRKPPDHDHVEVRYVAASSSCNTSDRLLSVDQKNKQNLQNATSSPARTTCSTPRLQKVSIV